MVSSRGVLRAGAMALVGVAGLAASAQVSQAPTSWRSSQPLLRIPEPAEVSTLYATGEQILIDTFEMRWRPMCFNQSPMNMQQLRASQQSHDAQFAPGQPITVVDAPRTGRMSNVNIVFNLGGSVPAAAIPSFAAAEAYLEAQFADPITVTVSVSFANLGSGIIGATGSSYANNRSYTNVRDGLVAGMDANDTIQTSLPAGTTIPVRYVGTSATVTNESLIDMTRANFKAAIGTTTGSDGSMQYNSSFNFDYDPSNGITGSQTSLVDVIIHETGHAMGFVSAADSTTGGQMDTLDIFRFQNTDGTGDYNPDTIAEFSTTPRTVDYNTPNDDAISDIIAGEWRMSDGTPYQASHFREQTANIGIMDPAFAGGQTYFPNYFKTSDSSMFDAIGWDYPASGGGGCVGLTITDDPDSETVCEGDNVVLAVATTGSAATYEWRKNFVVIPGETGDTLTLTSVTEVDNECSSPQLSAAGVITVNAATDISDDPDSQTVDVGDPVSLSVTATGTNIEYQWKKDTLDIGGATGATYNIASAATGDAGSYTCLVTGDCGSVTSAAALLTVNDDTPPCAADYNGDTEGDVLDFLDFMDDFGTCENQPAPCGLFGGDFNGDTFIDVLDFLDFLDAFGVGCG
jgi:hypothetical protein